MKAKSSKPSSCEGPLRIAFFSPALPTSGEGGGIVTYTRIMRDALRELGHSVTVLTLDQAEQQDGEIIELPRPNRMERTVRRWAGAVRPRDRSNDWVRLRMADALRWALSNGAQLLEIEESFGWGGALAGRGVAIVERLHGPHGIIRNYFDTSLDEKNGDLREAAEAASFSQVEAITCPTEALLRAVLEKYDLDLPIARAIPNPMPLAAPGMTWRLDGADADEILCVGRFDLCKGADLVLRAFAQALSQRPSLRLVMVGPDTGLAQSDGTYMHFEDFAASELPANVRERVEFLGLRSSEEIARLRMRAGFALVGSRFETFSYVIAEAMAAGMPVLTTDTFGAREMVRPGVDGEIVPREEVGALARAIVDMAQSPARLAEMGSAARASVASLLSPGRIAATTAEVYRAAIGRLADRELLALGDPISSAP